MIGAKLKSARMAAGLSLRELAERVDVSHAAIYKYESDLDTPGSEIMIRLCRSLGVTLGWLMREPGFSLSQPAFRRKTTFGKKKQGAVLEKAQQYLERYVAIEQLAAPDAVCFEGPSNLKHGGSPMEAAEFAASRLRSEWELGLDPVDTLLEFVEGKGVKVVTLDIDDDGFAGCSLFIDKSQPVIIVSQKWPGDRQRFTVAHELGHLILRDSISGRDAELFANHFAAAFLLPAEAVRIELGSNRSSFSIKELEELKIKYGASMQTWVRRACDLGIISQSKYKQIMASFSVRGWRRTEPGYQIKAEQPQRFERLVYKGFAEGMISESRAAELLDISITEFRVSAQPLIGGASSAEACC
jgi:Zn-dependent peptidase ImmA (M78 family)/DNA-binding XRE family transcriptional regulator